MRTAVRIGAGVGLALLIAFGRLTHTAPTTEPSTYEECVARNIVCY